MTQTIAALSTPAAQSAIAMIRLSGDRAIEIAERVFRPVSGRQLSSLAGYSAAYGAFMWEDRQLDEGVVILYRAPKSYTGEDMAELCCHGNPLIAKELLTACIAAGAAPAAAGEFTKRAFLNGKLDLSQAEAVTELINAESQAAIRQALLRREGALGRRVDGLCDRLTLIAATLGVWADYPEEEDAPVVTHSSLRAQLLPIAADLAELIEGHKTGALIERGISMAVVGSPKVGKSTLANLLWGRERSIVTDIAGTTRDVVEADLTIEGIALRLLDTAGIRETQDVVEQIGVERSKQAIAAADLVLLLLDGTTGVTPNDYELLALIGDKPCILAANKTDIGTKPLPDAFSGAILLSARTGEGMPELRRAILDRLGVSLHQDSALIASERQFDCVLRCHAALADALALLDDAMTFDAIGILLDDAIGALLALTGRSVTEEVTANIFANFCVGK